MEDSLAPFADLLADDIDAVQEPGRLQEVNDYGQLYEYTNAFADFSIWDGGFESKQKMQQSPELFPIQTQDAEVMDQSGIASALPELLADDFADVSTSFAGEICAFCLESGVLIRCPKCKSAYYCSKEHQAAHSLIHETSCGNVATPSDANGFQFSESAELAPDDSELRSEMLELLNIFEVVYENKSAGDTCSLLKKCISMCERIMARYSRLPQVVAMHEQATTLLQMFQNDETECPFPNSATENRSSSEVSVRDHLKADVKEALDRVDRDAEESDLLKDADGGEEVNGVYRHKGIWYCKTHIDQEQCEQCEVDYRLLNQVHRETAEEEAKVDDTIRKEQQRLEELELQRTHPDSAIEEAAPTHQVHSHHDSADAEDFQSIAKDLKEELDRAREKEEADFLKCFSSFQIS